MKIYNLKTVDANNTGKSTVNTNFKAIDHLNLIKYVPNINCACCNKQIINGTQASILWRKITKPLSSIMDKGLLSKWQENFPEIWAALKTLANKYPNNSLDQIMDDSDAFLLLKRCIVKNVVDYNICDHNGDDDLINRYTKEGYNYLLRDSRRNLKSAGVTIKKIAKYKNFQTGVPRETFEIMEKYADKYSYTSLSAMIRLKEIYNFHRQEYDNEYNNKQSEIAQIFNNINSIIDKLNINDKDITEELQQESMTIMYSIRDCFLRNYKIKQLYSDVLSKYANPTAINEIAQYINKLPDLCFSKHGFFSYGAEHSFNDYKIASAFINPISACYINILDPEFVEYGQANKYNKLLVCGECKDKMIGTGYEEYVKAHPTALEYTKRQLEKILIFIANQPEESLNPEIIRYPRKASDLINRIPGVYFTPNQSIYFDRNA